MPSKRVSPDWVPTQRYPSVVCAIDSTVPSGKPSRIFHDLCAYWLISSAGSRASAQCQANRSRKKRRWRSDLMQRHVVRMVFESLQRDSTSEHLVGHIGIAPEYPLEWGHIQRNRSHSWKTGVFC